ncbi:AAA family ATPase [Butyrivibrio sp. FC2001]|uniref:AAA family ATPase n=1 Tax=Butyrivibrio sp. FC2001 TaxID=1280671 RepID=UPI0004250AE9|nr:AAA family ATPase [Butyrivibrio sp. FC2001]
MIDYLNANNYKSFVNFKIEFKQVNLILGKNGSGKSNIFSLTFSLLELIRGNKEAMRLFFSPLTLTRWTNSKIQTFELGLSDTSHKFTYVVEIEQDIYKNQSTIISEKVTCDGKTLYQLSKGSAVLFDDDFTGTSVLTDSSVSGVSYAPFDNNHTLIFGFKSVVNSIIFCSPDPKAMVDTVINEELGAKVNFSNIASVYAYAVQSDPEVYSELMDTLKEIYPDLRKYRINVNQFGRRLEAEYQHKDVLCSYSFSELSDGERMTFSLYLLLYGFIKKGYTVLLDEPDNYLSLREIQPWCTEIESEISENGQCLMISHNPEVIDYFAVANGIWLSRLSSGESTIVDDPLKNKDNKDLFTYSELIVRGMLDEVE